MRLRHAHLASDAGDPLRHRRDLGLRRREGVAEAHDGGPEPRYVLLARAHDVHEALQRGRGFFCGEVGGFAEVDHDAGESCDVVDADAELASGLSDRGDLLVRCGERLGHLPQLTFEGLHLRGCAVDGLRDTGPVGLPGDRCGCESTERQRTCAADCDEFGADLVELRSVLLNVSPGTLPRRLGYRLVLLRGLAVAPDPGQDTLDSVDGEPGDHGTRSCHGYLLNGLGRRGDGEPFGDEDPTQRRVDLGAAELLLGLVALLSANRQRAALAAPQI